MNNTRLKALQLEARDKGLHVWKPKTAAGRARRSAIIQELCKLSRDGWAHALPCDYEPLENELRKLEGL